MRFINAIILALLSLTLNACSDNSTSKINRREVVERHIVKTEVFDPNSPAQVGNGEFAFGVDITGLQTFAKFNTMSNWAWHSSPIPGDLKLEDFKGKDLTDSGRKINYPIIDQSDITQRRLGAYLSANPHRLNLARIGFEIKKSDGSLAHVEDLKNTRQKVDIWSGIITSRFEIDGNFVEVLTAVHPKLNMIAVYARSPILRDAKINVFIEFPYGDEKYYAFNVGNFNTQNSHQTNLISAKSNSALFKRTLDDTEFYTAINCSTKAHIVKDQTNKHKFHIIPDSDVLEFVCQFSKDYIPLADMPNAEETMQSSKSDWRNFWLSGAAIDFSNSKDARWRELERRVVLSQYLMRVNESGSLPPQESGLVCNTWFGRFHFEMIPYHILHYALWDRFSMAEKCLQIYKKFLPTSIERAKKQGYDGARYPKCVADFDREWPHPIHATLIWQQPHPIYFAETEYILNPSKQTLDKWKDIVFASADFLASLPVLDKQSGKYNLVAPLYIVSENTSMHKTRNPTFELAYWRYGLSTALKWQQRLGLKQNKKWKTVLDNLAPLPIQDGLYVTHEGIENMWTKYNFEHPALVGIYAFLPDTGIDMKVFKNTLAKVSQNWDFNRTWGWDFPTLALAAARSGDSKAAVDFLLHSSKGFQFDSHGLATGGPFPYMPSNGSLLAAVAIMAKGEMFPKDWQVKSEGFNPYQ